MSKFTRRDFIKRTAVAGAAATLLPRVALPFGQSPAGIRKFIVTLPGLGKKQANNMGNYIDVLTPDRVTYPGTDYYKIFARQFTQQIHPDIPATTFWGYAKNKLDQPTYPGGAIVMTKGRNVKLQVTNLLPHDHIVPVDWTAMDATRCSAFTGRNDRIAIHLHGGFVNWISDGGPFSWFSSATRLSKTNKNTDFVHGASFMNWWTRAWLFMIIRAATAHGCFGTTTMPTASLARTPTPVWPLRS